MLTVTLSAGVTDAPGRAAPPVTFRSVKSIASLNIMLDIIPDSSSLTSTTLGGTLST